MRNALRHVLLGVYPVTAMSRGDLGIARWRQRLAAWPLSPVRCRAGWRRRSRAIAAWLLVVVGVLANGVPSFAAKPGPRTEIDNAAEELRREFAAYVKDPKNQPLRDASDYFERKPNAAVTVNAVLAAVDQRLDPDVRVAAYIRWQLLSALPKELSKDDVPRAIAAYRRAPMPSPRFGLSERDQQALDAMLPQVRKTDDVVLTSRLEAQVKMWFEQNRHLIAYRNEWYRRLPKTPPVFAAAFEDAFERQSVAAGAEDFSPLVIAEVQQWMVLSANIAECASLAGVLARLRDQPAPPYYASAAVRSGKLTWVKKTDSMDPRKKLTHLHQALVEAAQTPAPKPVKP